MATCEHCTGTHYLADDPSLGACVCCTPEALQRVETALAARDRTVAALTATPPIGERIDAAIAALTDAQTEIETMQREIETMQREIDEDEVLDEQIAEIAAALRAYLASIGLPAAPVTTTDMPDELAALVAAAGLV